MLSKVDTILRLYNNFGSFFWNLQLFYLFQSKKTLRATIRLLNPPVGS